MFTKLGAGRVSQVRILTANFTVVALKCGLTGAEIAKIGNFWYKFAPNGYIPLSDFYDIWHGGGSLRPAPSCQISPLSVLKCGLTLQPPKSPKLYLFSYKFAKSGNIIIIIISTTIFMVLSSWQSHCESSPGSFDECRMAPSGRRPKTKPDT